jgi:hypothetical protein
LKVANRFEELSRDPDDRTQHSVEHYSEKQEKADDKKDSQSKVPK